MKIGISGSIDVTKIEKARLITGQKGTYLDFTTFVDLDVRDKFDNNGFVSQNVTKEERDAGTKGVILGNVKVFWRDDNQANANAPRTNSNGTPAPGFDDDIDF